MRRTPANEPELLTVWQHDEAALVADGLSRRQAHTRIADRYQTTRQTVYRWLTPSVRQRANEYARHWYSERYATDPAFRQERADYLREYKHARREQDRTNAQAVQALQGIAVEAFGDTMELTGQQLWDRVADVTQDLAYAPYVNRLHAVLPIEETAPGIYRIKADSAILQEPSGDTSSHPLIGPDARRTPGPPAQPENPDTP